MTRKAAHLQRQRRRWAARIVNELGDWREWHRLGKARPVFRRHLRALAVQLSHRPPVVY